MAFDKKAYMKAYREANKEKIAESNKKYWEDNKEHLAQRRKVWEENNKDYYKQYRQTPQGKKKWQIKDWKQKGMVSDDWDQVYELYTNETNCWWCNIEFGKKGDGTGTFKCLDHDHKTGELRCIVCNKCNLKLGA